ncbi:hypothetical protein [Paractinoplanes maris]|uniref:hypothetical protein n=1 Tax=Paractinoplanes maris TaxID=1734446 RepID=UPI002021A87C|nr:hypothetical protein [Actinoplanes maris]
MTGEMVVVQWADLTGTGFSRQPGDNKAPAEYWAAAEAMLQADLTQPPEFIRDTGTHPVWTLRHVPVGRRRRWCFVVQGRRGDNKFGVAGACRFAFAVNDVEACDAWRLGIAATGVRPVEPVMPEAVLVDCVKEVLLDVIAARDRILVGAEPAETAQVIARVLHALPESEARAISWSTCVLFPPGRRRRRELSGAWPKEFRAADPRLARAVTESFEEQIVSPRGVARLLELQKTDELGEFLDQVVHEQIVPAWRRDSRDLGELISRTARSSRRLGIDDVARLIVSPVAAEELNAGHPELISRWVAERPDEAAGVVRRVTDTAAAHRILDELIQAQSRLRHNLIGLPTAAVPGPDPWHRRLTELLSSAYNPHTLQGFVADWLQGVWADPDDAAAGREFLQALGLDRHRYPRLYRARPDRIVADLNLQRKVTDSVAIEFSVEPDPLALLAQLCPKLRPLSPRTVVELIEIADRSNASGRDGGTEALASVASALTGAWLQESNAGPAVEERLGDLVMEALPNQRIAGVLLSGGMHTLLKYDGEAPHGKLLELCQQMREHTYLPPFVMSAISAAERRLVPAYPPSSSALLPASARIESPAAPPAVPPATGNHPGPVKSEPQPLVMESVLPLPPEPALLFRFGKELTQAAQAGELSPVVGRDREIDHLIQIISRRTRNNPFLIGEPGVGKTAVIEGLAQRIATGTVPPTLAGKLLYGLEPEVDGAGLLAEIDGRDDVLLVVEDRIPVELVAPLSRRGLRLIATGTAADYDRELTRDRRLTRIFQPLLLAAPTVTATVTILEAVRAQYEKHHQLSIADDALAEAARLADRHLGDRHLPSAAVDLIDDAAAWLAVHNPGAILRADVVREALDRQSDHRVSARTLPDAPSVSGFKDEGGDVWMMA